MVKRLSFRASEVVGQPFLVSCFLLLVDKYPVSDFVGATPFPKGNRVLAFPLLEKGDRK